MATPDPKEQTNAMWILLIFLLTIGALLLFDLGLWKEVKPLTRKLWTLRNLPVHTLGDGYSGPARYHGTLRTNTLRATPAGNPSVMYYAWVEDHYRSGRSTVVRTLCSVGEDEQLTFHQGSQSAPFELFHHDEDIVLRKSDGWLQPVPMNKVGIDLGAIEKSNTVPDNIRQRCMGKLIARGTMRYKEASITSAQPVVIVACQKEGVLRSCPAESPVLGLLAADSMERLLDSYAQQPLNWLRGPTLLLLILVSYLCSLLFRYSGGDS